MARILVFKDPSTPEFKEYNDFGLTIEQFIKKNDLGYLSFNVVINGNVPDEIDINYIINKHDEIIFRVTFEGNDPDNDRNKTESFLIQTITAIAAIALAATGYGAVVVGAVMLGGGLLAGAVRYFGVKQADMSNPALPDTDSSSAPVFSLSAAQNEARPLQPMPLVLGSHRFAPDFFSQPYPNYYGGKFESAAGFSQGYFIPPGDPNTWDTLPAFSIMSPNSTPVPMFTLKIMPQMGLTQWNALTATQRREFAPQYVNQLTGETVSGPVVAYHNNPADPHFGKFSMLNMQYIMADYITGSRGYVEYVNGKEQLLFSDNTPLPTSSANYIIDIVAYLRNVTAGQNLRRWKIGTNDFMLLLTGFITDASTQIRNFNLNTINGDSNFDQQPKPVPFRIAGDYQKIVETPVRSMTHVFNFGLGDLVISDRRVDKVQTSDIVGLQQSEIDRDTWTIPTTLNSDYLTNVVVKDGASLVNDETFQGPNVPVSPVDNNKYNFTYRESPLNTRKIEIDIESQLYGSGASGFEDNENFLEIQYRIKGDTVWIPWPVPVDLYYKNNTPLLQRRTFSITLPSSEIWELRIRKVTPDSINNVDKKVAKFDFASVKWFLFGGINSDSDKTALNLDGLFLVANAQTSGQTNKYSALVESKAYVFDGAVWSWELTRNPAWLFLYFARGGFVCPSNDSGTSVWPDSPTTSWTNNADNVDNVERIFGGGLKLTEIDLDSIIEWAAFCDDKDLKCDLVIKDNVSCQDILLRIAETGRASLSFYEGKLSVIWESEDQMAVALFGMGNIIKDSFQVRYANQNIPSKIIGNYTDRDYDWDALQVEADVPDAPLDDLNFVEVNLTGVTEADRAQREVNILAARQAFTRTIYEWISGLEGLVFKRGDLVYLSHDLAQHDFSGRLTECTATRIVFDRNVTGVEKVFLRLPTGDIIEVEGQQDSDKSFVPDTPIDLTGFPNEAVDIVYIAGERETSGLLVRISEIMPDSETRYKITAIQEEKAIYAYEYDDTVRPDEVIETPTATLENFEYKLEGNILIVKFFKNNAHGVMFEENNLLLAGYNGAYTFFNEAKFELPSGFHTIVAIPFQVGGVYNSQNITFGVEVP